MVRARTRRPRRRAAGKRVARKSKKSQKAGQYATITETIQAEDLLANTDTAAVFNLSQFQRASRIASNFKWYKAAKVTYSLVPLFNTFQEGIAVDSVPYLYTVMNRTQDGLAQTVFDLQAMGAKPARLVGKKTISYVPNWCSGGLSTYSFDPVTRNVIGGTNQGLRAQYAYLACPDSFSGAPDIPFTLNPIEPSPGLVNASMTAINANQVTYNGHNYFVDQLFSGGLTNTVARLTCTVTWLFKDPHFNAYVREPAPVPKVEAV